MGEELRQLWSVGAADQAGDAEGRVRSRRSQAALRRFETEEDVNTHFEGGAQLLQATRPGEAAERKA